MKAWHWDGVAWSEVFSRECPDNCQSRLLVIGPNDVRVARAPGFMGPQQGWMERWDGTQWTDITDDTIRDTYGINGMAATSANDIWLNTNTGFLHWNGTSWTSYAVPDTRVWDMAAISPNDVWAVGPYFIRHWDGTQWGRVEEVEGMGYVRRERDKEDERNVRITLTDAGRALREKGLGFGKQTVAASGLGPEEFPLLQKAVVRLRDNLIEAAGRPGIENSSIGGSIPSRTTKNLSQQTC